MDRRQLDAAFPTIVRYVGLVLGTVLVLAPIVFDVDVAAVAGGYPLATGMILYKSVKSAVENGA